MKPSLKKAYNTLYWNLHYSLSYSSVAGLGNGLGNINEGESFNEGFSSGYINHFPTSFLFSFTYPLVLSQLKKTNHYRLYANIFQVGMTATILAAHYWLGTENPISAVAPMTAIAFPMINHHVSKTLEEKVK